MLADLLKRLQSEMGTGQPHRLDNLQPRQPGWQRRRKLPPTERRHRPTRRGIMLHRNGTTSGDYGNPAILQSLFSILYSSSNDTTCDTPSAPIEIP